MYSLWSTLYVSQEVDDYSCYVNVDVWLRLMNEYNTNRIFARIIKDDKYWLCSLGSPISTSFIPDDNSTPVFLPHWMLEQLDCIDCNGSGENIIIEWMPDNVFDESTHIVLEPFDSTFHCDNIEDLLSVELTKLAILRKDTNIHIKLNGLEVLYRIKDLQPASIVLCQGDNVGLEIINRPPTPYPFDRLPTLISPYIPETELQTPIQPPIQPQPRFNPWRNKDFKPNVS